MYQTKRSQCFIISPKCWSKIQSFCLFYFRLTLAQLIPPSPTIFLTYRILYGMFYGYGYGLIKMLLPMIDFLSIHVIKFLIDSLPLDSVHKYLAF